MSADIDPLFRHLGEALDRYAELKRATDKAEKTRCLNRIEDSIIAAMTECVAQLETLNPPLSPAAIDELAAGLEPTIDDLFPHPSSLRAMPKSQDGGLVRLSTSPDHFSLLSSLLPQSFRQAVQERGEAEMDVPPLDAVEIDAIRLNWKEGQSTDLLRIVHAVLAWRTKAARH